MGNRSRHYAKPREPKPKRVLTEEEKLAKEKERIRKLQLTLYEQDGTHYKGADDLKNEEFLALLRREHPDKDPDKIK